MQWEKLGNRGRRWAGQLFDLHSFALVFKRLYSQSWVTANIPSSAGSILSCWGNRCKHSGGVLRHRWAAWAALQEKEVPGAITWHSAKEAGSGPQTCTWTLALGNGLASLSLSFLIHEIMKWRITKSMAPNLAQIKHIYPVKVSSLPPLCQALLEPGARDTGDPGHKTDSLTVLTGQQTDCPTEGHSKHREGIKDGGENTWKTETETWWMSWECATQPGGRWKEGCAGKCWAHREVQ